MGGGSLHLYSFLEASQQKLILNIINGENNLASLVPRNISNYIITDLRDLATAANWELKLIAFIFSKLGLDLYARAFSNYIFIRKTLEEFNNIDPLLTLKLHELNPLETSKCILKFRNKFSLDCLPSGPSVFKRGFSNILFSFNKLNSACSDNFSPLPPEKLTSLMKIILPNISSHEMINMQPFLSLTFDKVREKTNEHKDDIAAYLKERKKCYLIVILLTPILEQPSTTQKNLKQKHSTKHLHFKNPLMMTTLLSNLINKASTLPYLLTH